MNGDIRQEHGHYRLEIDGKFVGNYDTFSEALKELEEEKEESSCWTDPLQESLSQKMGA